jgi:hypothetical protein
MSQEDAVTLPATGIRNAAVMGAVALDFIRQPEVFSAWQAFERTHARAEAQPPNKEFVHTCERALIELAATVDPGLVIHLT